MMNQAKHEQEHSWRSALGPLGTPRRFGPLLVVLLATAMFQIAAPDSQWTRFIAIILLAGTLVLTLWASGVGVKLGRVVAGIAGVIVILAAGALFGPAEIELETVGIAELLLVAIVPTTIGVAVLRDLRDSGRVTLRAVFGVLCIYLVLGMGFAYIGEMVESISNQPFFSQIPGEATVSDFLFFSYATLTTVGYGDYTVANQAGRTLATVEALIGQIYVITVVAIIVGNLGGVGRSR